MGERRESFPSKAFRRFWVAGAVSSLGTYITLLALQTLVVLDLGGDATTVGWLNSARWLPYLVLGLLVGALVDRRPRRPVLVASDLAQAALLAVIPVTWALGALSLPVVLGVVVAYGTVSLVGGAAEMSFLPRLVDRRDLQRAHVRVDGADAVAQNAGPALGGLLVTLVGAPLTVLADAATYLFSAVMTAMVRVDEPPVARDGERRNLRREVGEGLRWIYGGSALGRLAVSTHVWFVGNAVIGVVVAPFALTQLGLSAFQLGLAGTAAGVGALLGTAASTPGGRRWGTGVAVVAGHAVSALGAVAMLLAGVGTSGWGAWAVLAIGQGLHGAAIGFTNSHEMAYRQTITPDALQGRTNTTLRSLNRAVIVVVAPLAGVLADAAGLRTAFAVAAVAFAVACLLLAGSPFRGVRLDDGHG